MRSNYSTFCTGGGVLLYPPPPCPPPLPLQGVECWAVRRLQVLVAPLRICVVCWWGRLESYSSPASAAATTVSPASASVSVASLHRRGIGLEILLRLGREWWGGSGVPVNISRRRRCVILVCSHRWWCLQLDWTSCADTQKINFL